MLVSKAVYHYSGFNNWDKPAKALPNTVFLEPGLNTGLVLRCVLEAFKAIIVGCLHWKSKSCS